MSQQKNQKAFGKTMDSLKNTNPIDIPGIKSKDICHKECTDSACTRKHPFCKNFNNCLDDKCGFIHKGGKRNVMCPNGMKCKFSTCINNHPHCKDYNTCKNEKCGYLHNKGKRYTRMNPAANSSEHIKKEPAKIPMCDLKERCRDEKCVKEHPKCQNGDTCGNIKCGFLHPNGKRFTNEYLSRSDTIYYPIKQKTVDIPLKSAVKRTYQLSQMHPLRNTSTQENYFASQDDESTELIGVFTEVISAKGFVDSVHEEDGGKRFAMITVYPPSVHKSTELLEASKGNKVKLIGKLCNALCNGDRVSFQLRLLNGQLYATSPKILKFNPKHQRTDNEAELLITIVLYDHFLDLKLFSNILDAANTWSSIPIRYLVVAIRNLMRKRAYIFISTSFQNVLLQSLIFVPDGVICRNLSSFLECELDDLKEMIGAIVMLNVDNARLFVHIVTRIAGRLCAISPSDSLTFLSDVLVVALPRRPKDRIGDYHWWQLPPALLSVELVFKGGKNDTSLDDLPCVSLGSPYASIETYISTYFHLHRADCYYQFREDIKVLRDDTFGPDVGIAVFSRIIVWGVQVSEVDAVVTMQLSVVPKNPSNLRYDCLKKGNMIAISLNGEFSDLQLIWGEITSSISGKDRGKCRSYSSDSSQQCRISFAVKWCDDINHTSNGQLLDDLQSHYHTARLVENKACFVSYGPVLKTLKSFWKPGQVMSIPFQRSLLEGQLIPVSAEDTTKFCQFGEISNFPRIFDQWQLEAYNHASLYSFALIHGPPGTGKSFLGARIARTLVECTERLLVVTSKNHALDEILIDIADLYGSDGMSKIIRVGKNKKINELLLPRTLLKLQEEREGDCSSAIEQRKLHSQLKRACNCLSSSFRPITATIFLRATGQEGLNTLHSLLNPYNCTFDIEEEQRNLTYDEKEICDKYLSDWAGYALSMILEKIPTESDVELNKEGQIYDIMVNDNDVDETDEIPRDSYLALINHFGLYPDNDSNRFGWEISPVLFNSPPSEALVLMILRNEYVFLTSKFTDLLKELKESLDDESARQTEEQVNILRSVPILGATVLGAILHIDAIAAAMPTALLIEEGGEVSEAVLIALLNIPSLERCVMIGDPKQLRPSVNTYELVKHKHLDISCFERLVLLKMPAPCLRTQNRMRLDVLLPVLQFYPDLQTNDGRIAHLMPVPWLPSPLYWWDCDSPGTQKDSSWNNDEQAKRVTELAKFLVSQGSIEEERITILVPYTSQRFLVLYLLKKMGLTGVQCSSIDQCQGDENDIILVCLVRCDLENPGKLGFLKDVSRMVVATSRQRRCLIIVGSSQCFRSHTEWNQLIVSLEDRRVSKEFPLQCPRHPHNFLKVLDSRCFPKGCADGCQTLLECGHKCTMKCHPSSISHEKCQVLVSHTYNPCGHTFESKCSEIDSCCPQIGSVQLLCGHKKDVKCGLSKIPEELLCTSNIEICLPCGHSMSLRCIVNEEIYKNEDFNPCFTCQLGNMDREKFSIVRKFVQKVNSKNTGSHNGKKTFIDGEGIAMLNEPVIRLKLCKMSDSDVLDKLLGRARISLSLLKSAIPPIEAWDHTLSSNERMEQSEKYYGNQLLWRFLLQEIGFKISKEWQENSLTLLSAMAMIETLDLSNYEKKSQSDAEMFAEKLEILNENGIVSDHDFFVILKEAGDNLYDALSTHDCSTKWYDTFEPILAGSILKRLQSATVDHCDCKVQQLILSSEIDENNKEENKESELLKRSDEHSVGLENKNIIESRYETKLADKILELAFKDKESEEISCLRSKWGLYPVCDIIAPPSSEIPHDFLYQRSFADYLYVSIDLKSADFHVLKLAVPELLTAKTWGDFVRETVPDLVERISFLPDLKSLRVRTLGKLFHHKNVALQGHCLRIITRVLLIMAQDMNSKALFDCIDYVFHFSCDELCLRLSSGSREDDAHRLSEAIKEVFENQLGWDLLLPMRIEVFNLRMVPLSTLDDVGQHVKEDDKVDGYTRLHYGHPLLKTSATFKDLPGVSEMSWREQPVPILSKEERCDDYYFERNICVKGSIIPSHGAIKKLSFRHHPSVLLNRFKLNELSKIIKLSAIAPEFKFSSQIPVINECILSSKAEEFIPFVEYKDTVNDDDYNEIENDSDVTDHVAGGDFNGKEGDVELIRTEYYEKAAPNFGLW